MKLILDTNVFDILIADRISIKDFDLQKNEIFITHIQVDELNECSDSEKRARLFNVLTEIRPIKRTTESFIIGTSRIGEAKINDGSNLIDKLRMNNFKNTNDAIIGETAIKNNLTLVTNDKKFKNKVIKLGGHALTIDELITEQKK